jgi:hypothetical protein
VPEKIIDALKTMDNTQLVEMKSHQGVINMTWRFTPLFEDGVDVVLVRDTDSRLNIKEVAAVKEWLATDKNFHIMRDHMWHGTTILGGMFGARKGILKPLKALFHEYPFVNVRGSDQQFLHQVVYPYVQSQNTIFSHDSHFRFEADTHLFPPVPYPGFTGFVGEVVENVDVACDFLNEPRILIKKEDNCNRQDYSTALK